MSIRRPDRRARLEVLALASAGLLFAACASSGSGVVHIVRPGENLYRIGLIYGVSAAAIARENGIRDVTALAVGTRLRIPRLRARPGRSNPGNRPPATQSPRARADTRLAFAWPLPGTVTSRFGRRGRGHHDGIDIDGRGGDPILAAEAGKVIEARWFGDYGRMVVIKHAGRYSTVYAHASKLLVRSGSFVERGQKIALVGATGNATGTHLHFEIRRGDSARDPMSYLPRR